MIFVAVIKKKVQIGVKYFFPGQVILTVPKIVKLAVEKGIKPSVIEFVPLNDFYKPFNYHDHSQKHVMVFRTGGIGDLIALSGITAMLKDRNIQFFTQKKYYPIFHWFADKAHIQKKNIEEAITSGYGLEYRMTVQPKLFRAVFEGEVERGGSRNWNDVFLQAIGIDPDRITPEMKCPKLAYPYHELPAKRKKQFILICHRASSQMRSMALQDICEPLDHVVKDRFEIRVHANNLTPEDQEYAKKNKYVKLIGKRTLEEYFIDLFEAAWVISVDTVAIHFREGVGKPAIGLYGAFSAECRTKYYQVTKSYDVLSLCKYQPCFIHQKKRDQVCPSASPGATIAPCMASESNPGLSAQLTHIFKNNIK